MEIIEDLKDIMKEKELSADTMSKFIGCSSRQVYRWLLHQSKPTMVYQILIQRAIEKVKKL